MYTIDITIGSTEMSNPKDFKKNSDWLTFAEIKRVEKTFTVPAGSVAYDDTVSFQFVVDSDTLPGAIDRVMIDVNGKTILGSQTKYSLYRIYDLNDEHTVTIVVSRNTGGELIADVSIYNNNNVGSANYPAITFKVSACQFKPPNIL